MQPNRGRGVRGIDSESEFPARSALGDLIVDRDATSFRMFGYLFAAIATASQPQQCVGYGGLNLVGQVVIALDGIDNPSPSVRLRQVILSVQPINAANDVLDAPGV